jgi:uncharacterized BrkB/YihY/UPF0761 family membrane protein
MRERIFFAGFLLILCIAILHIAGTENNLYIKFWWYDVLLHYLGGMWIALATYWIAFHSRYISHPRNTIANIALLVIGMTMLVGLGWEIFEYYFGISLAPGEQYVIDTTQDFIMDFLGAATIVVFVVLRKLKP